jgi:hypothetical protein
VSRSSLAPLNRLRKPATGSQRDNLKRNSVATN